MFGNGFDLLKADPETAQAEDKPIQALDKEEDDTGIGQELKRRGEVLHAEPHPSRVDPIEGASDSKRRSPEVPELER